MEIDRTGCPCHGIVTKTVHKTLLGNGEETGWGLGMVGVYRVVEAECQGGGGGRLP